MVFPATHNQKLEVSIYEDVVDWFKVARRYGQHLLRLIVSSYQDEDQAR